MIKSGSSSIYCDECGKFGDGVKLGDLYVLHPRTILAKRGWKVRSENGVLKDYCYECSKKKGLFTKPTDYLWWDRQK